MLKFLENRQEDKSPKRSPIKYLPEMCYGNSFECPSEFQTKNTIFYRRSYISPFLKFEHQRSQKIPEPTSVDPKWTHKTNLSLIQQHKILKDKQEGNYDQLKSRYLDTFHQEFKTNPSRFRITRGEFTNFIEKNNHYKSIGPLQGIERTTQRIDDRRKSVWIKPYSKKQEMTASLRYASSLNTTVKSSISKNSELLTEKIRIRRNRERVQKIFKRQLQIRKESPSYHFQMPRVGPQHELYLVQNPPGIYQASNRDKSEMEDLQKFQSKIYRKFK